MNPAVGKRADCWNRSQILLSGKGPFPLKKLAILIIAAFALAACEKGTEALDGQELPGAGESGAPTCERLAKILDACISKIEGPNQETLRNGLKQNREAWKENPDKKKLDSSCKQAWDNAKKEVGALCPSVKWE